MSSLNDTLDADRRLSDFGTKGAWESGGLPGFSLTKVAKDGWSLSGSSSELSSLSSLSTAKPRAGRPSFFT
jgi:hypothetical protein